MTTQALFGQETDIERLPLGPRRRSSGATVSCAGPGSNSSARLDDAASGNWAADFRSDIGGS